MDIRQRRLEWISLVYLLFFVLAVFSPTFYHHSYFGLPEEVLEEITIFVFGLAGIVTFSLYERLMERRERERDQAQNQYQNAKVELMDSYAYIGSVNRKIELLKQLANETSSKLNGDRQLTRELFQSLLTNACSAVGAESAMLRMVEHTKLRTEREFFYQGKPFVFRVPNRDLRTIHEKDLSHSFVLSEDGRDILVIPSDKKEGEVKTYLLLRLPNRQIPEVDASLLKVFVNQAEMLYRNFPVGDHVDKPAPVATGAEVESSSSS